MAGARRSGIPTSRRYIHSAHLREIDAGGTTTFALVPDLALRTPHTGSSRHICAYLATAVLARPLANRLLGLWWLDPAAAGVVAAVTVTCGPRGLAEAGVGGDIERPVRRVHAQPVHVHQDRGRHRGRLRSCPHRDSTARAARRPRLGRPGPALRRRAGRGRGAASAGALARVALSSLSSLASSSVSPRSLVVRGKRGANVVEQVLFAQVGAGVQRRHPDAVAVIDPKRRRVQSPRARTARRTLRDPVEPPRQGTDNDGISASPCSSKS